MRINKASIIYAVLFFIPVISSAQALEFDQYEYDFGTIKSGDSTAVHVFDFCNATTDTLQISRIEAPCSVSVMYNSAPVAPDMADAIIIKADLNGVDGDFQKHIFVYGNFDTFALEIKGRRNLGMDELYDQWQQEDQDGIAADTEDEDEDKPRKKKKPRRKKQRNR